MCVAGWVDTEMGSQIDDWVAKNFPKLRKISAEAAAEGTLKVFHSASLDEAVEFYMWDGTKLPW